MAVKVEILNRNTLAREVLLALCSSGTAIETTAHYLAKASFEIADAFTKRQEDEENDPQNQV